MGQFRNRLKELDDDELDDVVTSVNRERARRSQRQPSEMSDSELARWSAEQIEMSERAKAQAAKEQGDGSE
jgi:hypothetical protein